MSKNTGTSELINYFDLGVNGDVGISGSLTLDTIANAVIDTDKFLVSDNGIIKYRTGAELLSDIGVAGNYVTIDTAQTITGAKTFSGTNLQLAEAGSADPTILRNTSGDTGSTTGFNTIGFNNVNNLFVSTQNRGGFILGFNNSVSNRTYTLPDASGTIALTSSIPANPVGGTGTTNYLPKFTGASTIGDSLVYDNGSTVLIGTTTAPTPVVGVSFPLSITSAQATRIRIDSSRGAPNYANAGVGLYASDVQKWSFAHYSIDSGANYDFTIYNDALTSSAILIKGSNSNVLIGTTTDNGAKLQVSGAATFTGTGLLSSVRINNTTASTGKDWHLYSLNNGNFGLYNNTDGSYAYQVTPSGNVGIGTSSPVRRLDVVTTGEQLRLAYDTSGSVYTDFRNDSAGGLLINTSGGYIVQYIAGSPIMRMNANGNVLIGTTTDGGQKLQVNGATRILDGNVLTLMQSGNGNGSNIRSVTNGDFRVTTGGTTDALTITNGGNVGIGTNSPEHKLDVRSPSGNNVIRSNVTITSDGQQAILAASAIWSGAERGVSLAIYKHSAITNPASYVSFFGGGSTFRFTFIDDSGVLRISENSSDIGTYGGTVVGTQTSDIRLKNVKDEFNYGLKEILQINPIAFTFKKDENQVEKLGFSAQEIINIIPESVYDTGNCIDGYEDTNDPMLKIPKSNNTILAMDYSVIIPVLVKAIQEQQQQIDKLKNA